LFGSRHAFMISLGWSKRCATAIPRPKDFGASFVSSGAVYAATPGVAAPLRVAPALLAMVGVSCCSTAFASPGRAQASRDKGTVFDGLMLRCKLDFG
jgi:hypothetical protein